MKISDLLKKIEDFAPTELAYDWDNCGLICGSEDTKISGICVCLDVSDAVIKKAIEQGCNTILSHHPFIFSKLNKIDTKTYFGKMLTDVIKNDINVISMHTNIDKAKDGINQRLAQMLELENIEVLEEDAKFEGTGLGRVGTLKNSVSLGTFCEFVAKKLGTQVRIVGDTNTQINKVATGGGSCFELADMAIQKGCDVFVTGDIKYHQALDAQREGICIIDAGHYATEICVVDIFKEILKDTGIKIVEEKNCEIFMGL